jgi:hypothetical protein
MCKALPGENQSCIPLICNFLFYGFRGKGLQDQFISKRAKQGHAFTFPPANNGRITCFTEDQILKRQMRLMLFCESTGFVFRQLCLAVPGNQPNEQDDQKHGKSGNRQQYQGVNDDWSFPLIRKITGMNLRKNSVFAKNTWIQEIDGPILLRQVSFVR